MFDIYKNKKVLITGHTGFKGSWLSIWLHQLGANVIGYALDIKTDKDIFVLSSIGDKIKDYRGDICDVKKLQTVIESEKPEIVFHLAAQPIVLESYNNPLYTFQTNTLGTANVLEVIRNSNCVNTAIFVTSDKCYENKEWIWGYREQDSLGGYDPYSASKGAAELVINAYRKSFFKEGKINIASVRAGNVIGGGDWSDNRIIPDCIRAIEAGETIKIRNPDATRPWQHVLEPLGGYLLLGEKMMTHNGEYCEAWNFGPHTSKIYTVEKVVNTLLRNYGKGEWKYTGNDIRKHEAGLLALDIQKAIHKLKWSPLLTFEETIEFTANWYKKYSLGNVYQLCTEQIEQYLKKWKSEN